MSYTLKGRIQSRLAATVPALVVALALQRWWAIELVALMTIVGPSPVRDSTGASGPSRTDWRS